MHALWEIVWKRQHTFEIFKNSIDLSSILLTCANKTFQRNQPLPDSLRAVLFRLISKDPEQDATDLDNYRPIGLLHMAYRIISKVVTTRLQPMLSRLIGPHQFSYVSGRRSENIGRIIISEMMMQTISAPNPAILTMKQLISEKHLTAYHSNMYVASSGLSRHPMCL